MKRTLAVFVSLFSICAFPLVAQVDTQKQLARAVDLIQHGRAQIAVAVLSSVAESHDASDAERGRAWALLGYAYHQERQFLNAENAFHSAFHLLDVAGARRYDYASALTYYAGLLMDQGDLKPAAKALAQASDIFRSIGNNLELSQTHVRMAGLEIRRKKYKQAEAYLAGAKAESLASGETVRSPDIDATSGLLASRIGKVHEAVADYESALNACRQTYCEKDMMCGWLHVSLGEAQASDHDFTAALRNMNAGLEILKNTIGTANLSYVAAELTYSEILERAGSHEESLRISSAANASLKGLQSHECAQCSVSVWALQHQ